MTRKLPQFQKRIAIIMKFVVILQETAVDDLQPQKP